MPGLVLHLMSPPQVSHLEQMFDSDIHSEALMGRTPQKRLNDKIITIEPNILKCLFIRIAQLQLIYISNFLVFQSRDW